MGNTFKAPGSARSPELTAVLERLDGLVDWERRDRGIKGRSMRQSLAPVRDLLERMENPQRRFASVHVAGTKGKGSVASLIGAGLRRCGLGVAVYGSPHVERIHERIRLGRDLIGDAALARSLRRALDVRSHAVEERSPARDATWFDVLTAAAFEAMSAAGVEWAVVECGLGGRLDSTNVVRAGISVITNVDLEHTAILGSTRAAIAAEKAGIIAPGSLVVSSVGPPGDEAGDVVTGVARERGARLVRVSPTAEQSIEERNVELAGVVLDLLGEGPGRSGEGPVPGRALLDLFAREEARLPGRMERLVSGGLPVVLDGAHVPASLELVLRDLGRVPELAGPAIAVLGTAIDKDAAGLLKLLRGRVDRVLCTSTGTGPVQDPEVLRDIALRAGLSAEAVVDPRTALQMALRHATPGGWVLVTGSLHLCGELRGRLVAEAKETSC